MGSSSLPPGPDPPPALPFQGGEFATSLRKRIRDRGPISVEAYMAACNAHYYATRDPLGAAGDFTTAPEIHQMFGEMVGACLADCRHRAGNPDSVYAELGPGRGTLAADALRVIGPIDVHLVETSETLREAQSKRLPGATFHGDIRDLPARPVLLVANEFLDALPIRQWIGDEQRLIGLHGEDLAFIGHGMIVEVSPARDAAVRALAAHVARNGGIALLIDYGHARSAPGDTLQAVKAHAFADPLADPGEQDLTAHVDFQAVSESARCAGAAVTSVVPQGDWLRRIGVVQRAESLARRNPGHAESIASALTRLTDPAAMGDLFKVMAIHHPDWPPPAGFE